MTDDYAVTWVIFDPQTRRYVDPPFRTEAAADQAAARIPGATVEMVIPDAVLICLSRTSAGGTDGA